IALRDVGDLDQATTLLRRAERLVVRGDAEQQAAVELCRARLLTSQDKNSEAGDIIYRLMTNEAEALSVRLRVDLGLEALALPSASHIERPKALRLLCDALAKVQPPSARLMLVGALKDCSPFTDLSRELCEEFAVLFPLGQIGEDYDLALQQAE